MRLCGSLCNFACGNANGKKQAIAGGIEVLLASINNHLGCAIICGYACSGLFNIVFGSKENAELLISLGGGAAVAKVRTKWPDTTLQTPVRLLANLIVAEINAWVDEDEMKAWDKDRYKKAPKRWHGRCGSCDSCDGLVAVTVVAVYPLCEQSSSYRPTFRHTPDSPKKMPGPAVVA
jgi:hypothetical protein